MIAAGVVLLLVDAALIGIHLWYESWRISDRDVPAWLRSSRYSLDRDRGFAELVNYVKLSSAGILLLGVFATRKRSSVLAVWAVALFLAVADDALRLHEEWGGRIASRVDVPELFGLRRFDIAEAMVWGAFAALLLPLFVVAFRRSDWWVRSFSWTLTALLGLLVLFAAGAELLRRPLAGWERALGTIEDGGEIVVSSALVVVAIAAAQAVRPAPASRFGRAVPARRRLAPRAASAAENGPGRER
ncbi:MAG TPA: hypothetical protein VK915_13145 [Gaiellaceae bacterium]|nr:hypothetical protein [Gaiellaceae bacterium]